MVSLKHVGRIKATGKKVLVAFRTLPGDAYSCLVIPTESLDDSYHNALINLVEGNAAQTAYEFAEVLDRTQFPDGSRMLPSLHAKGKLIKVGTDQVEMVPTVTTAILLSELNQIIAEQRGVAVDDLHIQPSSNDKVEVKEVASVREIKEAPAEDFTRTTSASVNYDETAATVATEKTITFDSPEEEAKHYRSQADKLAKEAAKFRRLAEELVPAKKKK
jgi:hypothetical protein